MAEEAPPVGAPAGAAAAAPAQEGTSGSTSGLATPVEAVKKEEKEASEYTYSTGEEEEAEEEAEAQNSEGARQALPELDKDREEATTSKKRRSRSTEDERRRSKKVSGSWVGVGGPEEENYCLSTLPKQLSPRGGRGGSDPRSTRPVSPVRGPGGLARDDGGQGGWRPDSERRRCSPDQREPLPRRPQAAPKRKKKKKNKNPNRSKGQKP